MRLDLDTIDAVVFDLDDTLVDTAGQLVPPALSRAAEAMVTAGLDGSTDAVHEYLLGRAAEGRGGDYFGGAVHEFGVRHDASAAEVAATGRRTYLTADVGAPALLPGATTLLERLRDRVRLFLVTAGDPATQKRKVRRLDLGSRFEAICWVASVDGEEKLDAMAELLDAHGLAPARCVCVGDRIVGEIRDANRLGMVSVWMRRGEFRHRKPRHRDETPRYVVRDLTELGVLLGLEAPS